MMTRTPALSRVGPMAWLAAVAVLAATPAGAQGYVRDDCQPAITAGAPADPLTARWYRRFWTGECGDLHGCKGGSPNWNEIVGKLVARTDAAKRPAVLSRACRLGAVIGLEWTRPRKVRRIDTRDLSGFRTTLQNSRNILEGIERVEQQARGKIGGKG